MKTQITPNLDKMSKQQFFNQLTAAVHDSYYEQGFWDAALTKLAHHIDKE